MKTHARNKLVSRIALLHFGMFLVSHGALANGWHLPEMLKGERPISQSTLPSKLRLQHFLVTISNPADPAERALGGTGGGMIELTVDGLGVQHHSRDLVQAIHIFVQDRGKVPPLFSIWTKTGANFPVYCRYAYVERIGEYCAIFCDDYEVGEAAATRSDRPRRWGQCDEPSSR